jgi:hypothetical protein
MKKETIEINSDTRRMLNRLKKYIGIEITDDTCIYNAVRREIRFFGGKLADDYSHLRGKKGESK